MNDLLYKKLEDICLDEKRAIISGPFGSNISSKYFVDKGIPVIRGNNLSLSLDKFYDEGFVYVTKKKADELNCYAKKLDIIFTAAGTIGQVGLITNDTKYDCYVISNKQIRARLDSNKIDILYAYYWFTSPWIQKYLTSNNKGSTVPLLSLWEVKNLPIIYPKSMSKKKKISNIIDKISKKIELNNKINDELEVMAKTVYDYWFLQFEFPNEEGKPYKSSGGKMIWNEELKREIPEGWKVNNILNVCDVVDCLHSKKPTYCKEYEDYYLLTLENLTEKGYIDLSKKYYISKTDYEIWTSRILVKENDFVVTNAGRAGDIGKIPYGVKCAIGRNLTAIRPKNINPYYLRQFFKSNYLKEQVLSNLDCGSFFMSFNVKSIKSLNVLIPNEDIMKKSIDILKPIILKIENNIVENQELTSLRDFLLPLLMNGQVGFKEDKAEG